MSSSAMAADCPQTRTTADLRASLEKAQSSFSDLDVAGFAAAVDNAKVELPCLTDTLPRSLAAEFHRFVGLRAFVDQDPVTSTTSFAAARSIEPAYRFPESFIPAGNPVMQDYDAIDISVGTFTDIAQPNAGSLRFDGREALQRPDGWPTTVQLVSDEGSVTWTAYLQPGEILPTYDARALPKNKPEGSGPNMAMLGGGAGSLVLSGVFVGLAAGARSNFADVTTPYENVDDLARKANTMSTASVITGVLGLGLSGTAFVVKGR